MRAIVHRLGCVDYVRRRIDSLLIIVDDGFDFEEHRRRSSQLLEGFIYFLISFVWKNASLNIHFFIVSTFDLSISLNSQEFPSETGDKITVCH